MLVDGLERDIKGQKDLNNRISNMLREYDFLIIQGAATLGVNRKSGITWQTYYNWLREYGGMRIDKALSGIATIYNE